MTIEFLGIDQLPPSSEFPSIPVVSKAPLGLLSISDSISFSAPAPKPSFLIRAAASIGLIFLYISTCAIQFFQWILKNICGFSSKQKALYNKLHALCKQGNKEAIHAFLATHSKQPMIAGYLFSEFMRFPNIHLYLAEILEGANVCLKGDGGYFCKRWSAHPDAYARISSHVHQKGQCFAIGHLLFWIDLDGHTRFQFENTPLRGLCTAVRHGVDYLKYRINNEQQGVVGTSPYTEEHCLTLEVYLYPR